jgi:predicted DNA-binding ribbon-helix-helix protein
MKSRVIKHSILINGHKTSISLEDDFWNSLKEIAKERGGTLSQLIAKIDAERKFANLSSAIRLFVLQYYQDQCTSRERVDLAIEDAKPVA